MKKKLVFIIPAVLILCVLCGVVIFFAVQFFQNKAKEVQNQLGVTPTVTTATDSTTTGTPEATTAPSDNGSTSTSGTACSLMTPAIAKQILGGEVKQENGSNTCTYTTTGTDFTNFGVLVIIVTKSNSISAKSQFEQAKTVTYSSKTEAVSGLNVDDAYYADSLKQLSILKGDSWIIISGTSSKFTSEKDLAVATAKLVF